MTIGAQPSAASEPLLQRVEVKQLFGTRDYVIEKPADLDGRLFLLHGANGSGKTTLLRVLWDLLSAADNKGHRTHIAKTPFRTLNVILARDVRLSVEKSDDLIGSFSVRVEQPGERDVIAVYPLSPDGRVRSVRLSDPFEVDIYQQLLLESEELTDQALRAQVRSGSRKFRANETAQAKYIELLDRLAINPILLGDDRSLRSDDPELERARERVVNSSSPDPRNRWQDYERSLVANELTVTLRRVNDWLRSLTLGGQNSGSAQANSIYQDVLQRLGGAVAYQDEKVDVGDTFVAIEEIEALSPRYERFGLVPNFDAEAFRSLLLNIGDTDRAQIAARVLLPYLDSLKSRYDALADAERLLDGLVPVANDFLVDKQLHFSPRSGLNIVSSLGDRLSPSSLSSGERQLIMLLTTTLLASRDGRLLLIDEPELSLGANWQRRIIDALLDLTRGSNLQLMVATHSIEVMSDRPDCLVRLISSSA